MVQNGHFKVYISLFFAKIMQLYTLQQKVQELVKKCWIIQFRTAGVGGTVAMVDNVLS